MALDYRTKRLMKIAGIGALIGGGLSTGAMLLGIGGLVASLGISIGASLLFGKLSMVRNQTEVVALIASSVIASSVVPGLVAKGLNSAFSSVAKPASEKVQIADTKALDVDRKKELSAKGVSLKFS